MQAGAGEADRAWFPTVAVVDGPADLAGLSGILARPLAAPPAGGCASPPQGECAHGTFVVGLLGARADAPVPGLCPACPLVHIQLFEDGHRGAVSVRDLARAIERAVAAGAGIINLSLAVLGDSLGLDGELVAALDAAHAAGVVVVTAAGNQGRLAAGPLLSHAVTIPVAAVDAAGNLLPQSNLSPSIARRGVSARGQAVAGYGPGGWPTLMSGTSAAAAVATGVLARVWAGTPAATAFDLRAAVARLRPRRDLRPPLIRDDTLAAALAETMRHAEPVRRMTSGQARRPLTTAHEGGAIVMEAAIEITGDPVAPPATGPAPAAEAAATAAPPERTVALAHEAGGCGCGCGGNGDTCTCGGKGPAEPPTFVYALGSVEVRFPDPALEQEARDIAAMFKIEGQETSPGWLYGVLSRPEARYVARQLCYLFTVEGQPAYALKLRDGSDLAALIETLKPVDRGQDVDLVVGLRGPMIPPGTCNGLVVPMLIADHIMSFSRRELIDRIPVPSDIKEKPFRDTIEAVFDRLVQLTDNVGATDAHRALNFLAVRYAPLYQQVARMEQRGFQLTAVDVGVSRLSGTRRIVAPILSFQNSSNGFIEKYFVRVDVTGEFPMIATHLQPYFDR